MFDMDPEAAKVFYKEHGGSAREMTVRLRARVRLSFVVLLLFPCPFCLTSSMPNKPTLQIKQEKSGIAALVPGATIDDFAFDPCGYSMNAITYGNYATVRACVIDLCDMLIVSMHPVGRSVARSVSPHPPRLLSNPPLPYHPSPRRRQIHITPEPECSYASFETNTPLKSYDSLINNVLRVFRPKRFVLTMMADEGALVELESHGHQQCLPFERTSLAVPGLGHYSRASSSSTTFEKDYRCFMGTWTRDERPPQLAPAAAAAASAASTVGKLKKGKSHLALAAAAAQGRSRGVSFG